MTQSNYLIFGTGPVGKSVMRELVAQGHSVTMVNRRGKLRNAPEGVEVIGGDAMDTAFTKQVSKGKSVIFNATNPPYTQWPELFPKLNDSVLAGAMASGAKLVMMDNLYCYGDTHGKPLKETMPYTSHGRKPKTRAEMARKLLDAHEHGDVRVVLGRASDFFGPEVLQSSMGEMVFGAVSRGKTIQVTGKLDMPHTYTYMPDIGKALVTLAQDDDAYGRAWHLPNAETVTTRQFIQMIVDEAGLDQAPKIQVAGRGMLRVLGLFMPMMRELHEMVYEFEQPFIVDDSDYKARHGDHATPLKDAICETVAWYRTQ